MARPRSEQARAAALDATVDLLRSEGVEGVTLEEVAARSGVARSTLYRHFGDRETLIAEAAQTCVIEHPTPDTGSLEDDLRFLFDRFTAAEAEAPGHDLLPLLIDAAKRDPEIDRLVSRMLAERRRPVTTVLRLAQARGEISPDLELDTALAIIVGPITYRRLVERREVTPEFVEAILTSAVTALRATAAAPVG